MLAKDQRLNLKYSFKWVMAGHRAETSFYKMFWRFGDNTQPLISITASTKIFNKAVDRNRARRLTSAAIQPFYPQLLANLNMVIMPKYQLLARSSMDISKELKNSLTNAKVLK